MGVGSTSVDGHRQSSLLPFIANLFLIRLFRVAVLARKRYSERAELAIEINKHPIKKGDILCQHHSLLWP